MSRTLQLARLTEHVDELREVLTELLATDGGDGSDCYDAGRLTEARDRARILIGSPVPGTMRPDSVADWATGAQ